METFLQPLPTDDKPPNQGGGAPTKPKDPKDKEKDDEQQK